MTAINTSLAVNAASRDGQTSGSASAMLAVMKTGASQDPNTFLAAGTFQLDGTQRLGGASAVGGVDAVDAGSAELSRTEDLDTAKADAGESGRRGGSGFGKLLANVFMGVAGSLLGGLGNWVSSLLPAPLKEVASNAFNQVSRLFSGSDAQGGQASANPSSPERPFNPEIDLDAGSRDSAQT